MMFCFTRVAEVSLMLNVTQNYSRQFGAENVLFVDVGANLGSFTLPVAASGMSTFWCLIARVLISLIQTNNS